MPYLLEGLFIKFEKSNVIFRIVDPEMALRMLHKPTQKPPTFADPPQQQQPPQPVAQPVFPGPSRQPYAPPMPVPARPERPPMGYPDREGPPQSSFDMYRPEPSIPTPVPASGRFGRDPRNRDPRSGSDRGMGNMNPGPPGPLPPQLANADPARRQLLMQVLQLPDDQIAALPADQRASILELKKQINAYPK